MLGITPPLTHKEKLWASAKTTQKLLCILNGKQWEFSMNSLRTPGKESILRGEMLFPTIMKLATKASEKKKYFIINFNRYFQDLQNPSSSNILYIYYEIQTWQKLNRSDLQLPVSPELLWVHTSVIHRDDICNFPSIISSLFKFSVIFLTLLIHSLDW